MSETDITITTNFDSLEDKKYSYEIELKERIMDIHYVFDLIFKVNISPDEIEIVSLNKDKESTINLDDLSYFCDFIYDEPVDLNIGNFNIHSKEDEIILTVNNYKDDGELSVGLDYNYKNIHELESVISELKVNLITIVNLEMIEHLKKGDLEKYEKVFEEYHKSKYCSEELLNLYLPMKKKLYERKRLVYNKSYDHTKCDYKLKFKFNDLEIDVGNFFADIKSLNTFDDIYVRKPLSDRETIVTYEEIEEIVKELKTKGTMKYFCPDSIDINITLDKIKLGPLTCKYDKKLVKDVCSFFSDVLESFTFMINTSALKKLKSGLFNETWEKNLSKLIEKPYCSEKVKQLYLEKYPDKKKYYGNSII